MSSRAVSLQSVLASLLAPPPLEESPTSAAEVLAGIEADASEYEAPFDRAILHAGRADRLGFAFVAGYAGATRRLIEEALRSEAAAALPSRAAMRISLAATEEGGAHPRAIRAALTAAAGGDKSLSGAKVWCTLADVATHLLVIAREGEAEGRPLLRAVLVEAGRPGVTLANMPETPFCPEIHHARVELAEVEIAPQDVLPLDGFAEVLKPFRTVEDLAIQGAVLAWLTASARRFGFERALVERTLAVLAGARSLASSPPTSPVTHVALAGLMHEVEALLVGFDAAWASAPEEHRDRWLRDRPLLSIAARVRQQRLTRAWERLDRGGA